MSEEKKDTPQGEETVEALKTKIAELEADRDKAITERDNVVSEITDDRKKRQELTDEIDRLTAKLAEAKESGKTDTPAGEQDIEALLEKKLAERDASVAKGNKVIAIERFVKENSQFNPENDITGKRREALENAISRFNTSGLVTVEEYYSVVKDAARLLGNDAVPTNPEEKEVANPYASTPQSTVTPKVAQTDKNLTPGELAIMESRGWSKERFLDFKERNPYAVADLLKALDV